MTAITIKEKTVAELEAEVEFLTAYLRENSAFTFPSTSPKWSNAATTRLILWTFFGEEIPRHNMPWTMYDMGIVREFLKHVPEHLVHVMDPMIDEFKEQVAVRVEKQVREDYLRNKDQSY